MAIAIMLAVLLFPRRGEKARREATPFYEQLSLVAANMLPAADLARIPAQVDSAMKRPLKAAEAIWKYRFYGSMRLAVIGEYVQVWCDFVCRNYASMRDWRSTSTAPLWANLPKAKISGSGSAPICHPPTSSP